MRQPMTIFDRDAANAIVYEEHEPDEHARSRGIAHRTPRDPSEVVERVAALVAELRAARAAVERLTAERDAAIAERDVANCRYIDERNRANRLEHELERLRTAAADERADVIAKACVLAEYLARDHMPDDDKHAGHMIYTLAEEFESGAHVGAAKGGERG